MLPDELAMYSARITVDVTKKPEQSLTQVLADLDNDSLLGRFRLDDLVTQQRVCDALSATRSAEDELRVGGGARNAETVGNSKSSKGQRGKGKCANMSPQ